MNVTSTAAATLVAVRLGRAEFGLPVGRVAEVLPPPPITRLPFVPPELRGLTSVRGALIPVVDLGLRLMGSAVAPPGLLVVLSANGPEGPVGILVDAVSGLVDAPPDAVSPPPAEAEAAFPSGFLLGVVAPEPERLVTILDLNRVLALDEHAEEAR